MRQAIRQLMTLEVEANTKEIMIKKLNDKVELYTKEFDMLGEEVVNAIAEGSIGEIQETNRKLGRKHAQIERTKNQLDLYRSEFEEINDKMVEIFVETLKEN